MLAYEDTTARANAWLARQDANSLSGSIWLETELRSALARKIRTGRLSVEERDRALHRFASSIRPSLVVFDIDGEDFAAATRICDRYEFGVRAGDALHLAVALRRDAILCTFDKVLAAGAAGLGYTAELIA